MGEPYMGVGWLAIASVANLFPLPFSLGQIRYIYI